MTNASCADCGRIVAFRTHDLSEIAECRNCGTWVKRSDDMPGVAVSVKEGTPPTARKTAIPARKDNSSFSSQITKSTQGETPQSENPLPIDNLEDENSKESLSPAKVYAAIRDLQKSVHDLRAGQKTLQENQKQLLFNGEKLQHSQSTLKEEHRALHGGQKGLHNGLQALHSGQKQLFNQYRELQTNQATLLQRTADLPEMPVREFSASDYPQGTSSFQEGLANQTGPFTTPFSSLNIPIIPIKLEDLDVAPQFTDEGSVPAIPAEERSDRIDLIKNPLPEPAPYVEPEPAPEETNTEESLPEPTPFQETSLDSSPFSVPSDAETKFGSITAPHSENLEGTTSEPKADSPASPTSESESTASTHDSPFTIEGPPDDSLFVDQKGEGETTSPSASFGKTPIRPFAKAPTPFSVKEYSHEPCEIEDPFSETTSDHEEEDHEDPFNEEAPTVYELDEVPPLTETELEEEELITSDEFELEGNEPDPYSESNDLNLSQQIADAKQEQDTHYPLSSDEDLLAEPKKSLFASLLVFLLLILILATIIGGILFFFTDLFKEGKTSQTKAKDTTPLVTYPTKGKTLTNEDTKIAEAQSVAQQFLISQSLTEAKKFIRPVDENLLKDFWEPLTAPTIERTLKARTLENGRTEVDLIIKDFGREERLLPLVKIGDGPFQVDWKNFAECEEVTLLSLAQGTLILAGGNEVDQGSIRSWLQDGNTISNGLNLGSFQAFRLHNFTEEVVAMAVVLKESEAYQTLVDALAASQLKHKGKPAIQAILEVKRIEKEDPESKQPARMEIIRVLSTDWESEFTKELIEEQIPPTPTKETENNVEEAAPPQPANQPKEAEAKPEPAQNELPPVPDPNEPFASIHGETPVIQFTTID